MSNKQLINPRNEEEAEGWEKEVGFPLLEFPSGNQPLQTGRLIDLLPTLEKARLVAESLTLMNSTRKYVVYRPARILQAHNSPTERKLQCQPPPK